MLIRIPKTAIERLRAGLAELVSEIATQALETAMAPRPQSAPIRNAPVECADGFTISEHDGRWCVVDSGGYVRDRYDVRENAVIASHYWADMDAIGDIDDEGLAALWAEATEGNEGDDRTVPRFRGKAPKNTDGGPLRGDPSEGAPS